MCQANEYEKALVALGSLISGNKRSHGEKWQHAYEGMRVFLERLELDPHLHKLKVVHVAGTKGKGSTCAMVESILRNAGYRTGLFTSPHLVDVRERIRIDGRPISKELFLEHFWWCYSRLSDKADAEYGMAAYFRFLTLVAMRTFLEEGVDVAIMEVGLGGRLDATNCVRSPVVCGVTALGFDHMDVLGHTLPEIAREKAGIFKAGTPAYTVPQPPDALAALQEVAKRVGTSLAVVPPLAQQYDLGSGRQLRMRLGGQHQLQNASLAVALAANWEAVVGRGAAAEQRQQQLRSGMLPAVYAEGIQMCEWPGRSQVVHQDVEAAPAGDEARRQSSSSSGSSQPAGMQTSSSAQDADVQGSSSTQSPGTQGSSGAQGAGIQGSSGAQGAGAPPLRVSYYLDGAHTPESMATCADWFASATPPPAPGCSVQRVLVFNCMEARDPASLLSPLIQTLRQRQALPQHALFVVPDSSYQSLAKRTEGVARDTTWQQRLVSIWQQKVAAAEAASAAAANGAAANGSGTAPAAAATPAGRAAAFPQLHGQDTRRGAAVPSLADTIRWLHRCAREQPRRQLQVLVTGSLYIVGDALRHLGKSP